MAVKPGCAVMFRDVAGVIELAEQLLINNKMKDIPN